MSIIYLSEKAHPLLQDYLTSQGHQLIRIADRGLTYPAVATHADLYMCKLGTAAHSPVFHMGTADSDQLGHNYPENIKYNAVCMGSYFIHHLKYTAPSLLEKVRQLGLNTIQVPQGYSKCSMTVLSDTAAITADEGIYHSIHRYFEENRPTGSPIRLLLIRPGHVKLDSFPYGFLGGASGLVGGQLIFNGDLSAHPDFQQISDFISAQGLTFKYFPDYPLADIGSIIEWRDMNTFPRKADL
ncbi:hypothetical protein Ami103574_07085 [Aminipila butyrica]|uniref:DUF6873 domain-containing protein n=1 Tax=Aminipila butyrica TaxID=433296 RepID=A0A858BVG3_9FIRM|nr:hypothetical protein [Aminipila butyrica]QIB69098.1 hypothetical protein Ami103574_07085 [Aminipila butyrica]